MRAKGPNAIRKILDIPRQHWLISSEDLRDMWLDFPEIQELFENLIEQIDPEGYDKCIARFVLWFNGKLPRTAFHPAWFPDEGLLLNGSFVEVLKVAERYHAANFSSASGGGTSTPMNERYGPLGTFRRELEAQVEQRMQEIKTDINNESFYGGISDIGVRGEYGFS